MARTVKEKTPKKINPWMHFTLKEYEEVLQELVHFSAKTINSNTTACGIRIDLSQKSNFPYLSIRSLKSVPVDYTKNTGNKVTTQTFVALEDNVRETYCDIPTGELEKIRLLAQDILAKPYEIGTHQVEERLRQIIVQDAKGNNLALTPLQSAGFNKILNQRIEVIEKANKEKQNKKINWKRGQLNIGGSNTQNVGYYVFNMNRPLFFSAPHEDVSSRIAFALHFRGISLKLPYQLVVDHMNWRQKMMSMTGGEMPSDAKSRNKEIQFITEVVRVLLNRADNARQQLEEQKEKLLGNNLLSNQVDEVIRGLIIPSERTIKWIQDFAERLHREIIDTKVYIHGEYQTLGVGEYESVRWIKIIEDALL